MEIKLSYGYKIEEKKKTISLFEAYKLLTTKHQHHYTKVERCGDKAVLYWHILRCPYCNKEIPAYPQYLYERCNATPRKSFSLLYKWAQMQMPLFEDRDTILYFQQPEYYTGEYICTKCGKVSSNSNKIIEIEINSDENSVYITRRIENIKDMLELKWLSSINQLVIFPIYEKLVFDFDSGNTFLQLILQENVINNINLSDINCLNDIGIWAEHILKNNFVKRNLKKLFQHFHKQPIPFTTKEIDLEKLVLMTKFVDFPKKFYESVPLLENSYKVYESFSYVTNDLRNPQKAMKLLEKSSLPNTKSIRRLFAEKSVLFFYIKECEDLFSIIKDLNLFCKLLYSNKTYMIVAIMHYFPGIKDLYKDYCETKNAVSLCNVLESNIREITNQAIKYSVLSPFAKREEQNRWKKKGIFGGNHNYYWIDYNFPFFTPMPAIPENIKNCIIDNYYFKWLETKKDYITAAGHLHNCLGDWKWFDSPVVAIYKKGKIIAAMEINSEWVMQAYQKRNHMIEKDTPLYSAITKWCDIYSLKFGWKEING